MTIRPAREADIRRCFEMGVEFIVSNPDYATVLLWTPEGLEDFVSFLVLGEGNTILVAEDHGALVGMIALATNPNPFGGPVWVEEVAFWLDPPSRRGTTAHKLLGAAEDWARQAGSAVLKMVAPAGSHVGTLYQRRGYTPLETIWTLRL